MQERKIESVQIEKKLEQTVQSSKIEKTLSEISAEKDGKAMNRFANCMALCLFASVASVFSAVASDKLFLGFGAVAGGAFVTACGIGAVDTVRLLLEAKKSARQR